jgi:hypothetical protein
MKNPMGIEASAADTENSAPPATLIDAFLC